MGSMENNSLCRVEIGIDALDIYKMAFFWSKALGYQIGDLDGDGIYLDLVPPMPAMPVVFVQKVSEKSKEKNSFHIDIYTNNFEEKIRELSEMGAGLKGGPQTGAEGGLWQIMTDVEGNEFCVCLENQ